MTDRELLEAAAKAAGMRYKVTAIETIMRGDSMNPEAWYSWNPLTDDGDALRLLVKLNLDLEFDILPDGPTVEVCAPWHEDFGGYGWSEWLRKDAPAATRRAIVRAAAAMAKKEVA